jgi:hypothetical protein
MIWPYIFHPFEVIFRDSTVKASCFTIFKDLSIMYHEVITKTI